MKYPRLYRRSRPSSDQFNMPGSSVTSVSYKPRSSFPSKDCVSTSPTGRTLVLIGMSVAAMESPVVGRSRDAERSVAAMFRNVLMRSRGSRDSTRRSRNPRRHGSRSRAGAPLQVLNRVATFANCKLVPRVETVEGEVDAVMSVNNHVAVVEITSSSPREAETTSADWELLRDGLTRGFVENPSGKKGPYKEAVLQLVRDIRVLLNGKLAAVPKPNKIQRIYPVMIGADRRLRTPGVVNFLQKEFRQRLPADHRPATADLAVLGLEDIEELESILTATKSLQLGSVRGFLEILRKWDKERGLAPSWWQFVEVMWGRQRPNPTLQQAFMKWRQGMADRFLSS